MAHHTILLKGHDHHEEGVVGSEIYPGEAVEQAADGEYDPQIAAQAVALKGGLKIAKEDGLQGHTVDTPYVVGTVFFYYEPQQGDHFQALVKSGQNIAIGDLLVVEGGGSGLFVEAAGTETKVQLQALESSGGALAANTLLAVNVLAS